MLPLHSDFRFSSPSVTRPPREIKTIKTKNNTTMIGAVSRSVATRAAPLARRQQRRGIVSWMVNYPDKVMATKKIQMKGGTCQAEHNPTWLKQDGDWIPLAFGAALVGYGAVLTSVGFYRLATGKGKKPI
mmetsp:Transcript_14854/g.35741  ORF Transcript_14854/g.35741 Transcript_14854/m.35741 type:complete len:130 (-) Transcript_14854:442-831(-)